MPPEGLFVFRLDCGRKIWAKQKPDLSHSGQLIVNEETSLLSWVSSLSSVLIQALLAVLCVGKLLRVSPWLWTLASQPVSFISLLPPGLSRSLACSLCHLFIPPSLVSSQPVTHSLFVLEPDTEWHSQPLSFYFMLTWLIIQASLRSSPFYISSFSAFRGFFLYLQSNHEMSLKSQQSDFTETLRVILLLFSEPITKKLRTICPILKDFSLFWNNAFYCSCSYCKSWSM